MVTQQRGAGARASAAALALGLATGSCLVGGPGPPSTGGGVPSFDPSGSSSLPGLVAGVAGLDVARLDWVASELGLETALFTAASRATVYGGAPLQEGLTGESLVLGGLTPDADHYFGLALREDPLDPWSPTGGVLHLRTGAPIYVDPAAAPGGDGASPTTAYVSPLQALIDSFAQGGANIWMAGGDYGQVSLPVFDGSHLTGGFAPGFELAERDPGEHQTILRGVSGIAVAQVQGLTGVVLDGLVIDGGGIASHGIDVDGTPLEVRSTTVRSCGQRGFRVRAPDDGDPMRVDLLGCRATANGADGFSGSGVLDLAVLGSVFDSNGQEGLELDDLFAADGGSASLTVHGSIFTGNATEGLDVDLAASPGGGSTGGEFKLEVTGSQFTFNGGLAGLLIDIDYELAPAWKADIELVGCTLSSNLGAGLLTDVDSSANLFAHRLRAEANGGDGLLVTSESAPGLAVVSASLFAGNLGAGLRSDLGQVVPLVSHCLAVGNALGGFVSGLVPAELVGSVAYLQPLAFQGVSVDPTAGNLELAAFDPGLFAAAPEGFLAVTALAGDLASVASTDAVAAGAVGELAADDEPLELAVQGPTTLTIAPVPDFALLPASLSLWAPGSDVVDDYRPLPGSALEGAGFAAPGAPAVDAGPFGSPATGALGSADDIARALLRLKAVVPAPTEGLTDLGDLRLRFDGGVPVQGLGEGLRVTDGTGAEPAYSVTLDAGDLVLTPGGGGWGVGDLRVELHRELTSAAGVGLAAPVAVLVERP